MGNPFHSYDALDNLHVCRDKGGEVQPRVVSRLLFLMLLKASNSGKRNLGKYMVLQAPAQARRYVEHADEADLKRKRTTGS